MGASQQVKAGGLFLTHDMRGPIGKHYRKLRRETSTLVEWKLLFDPVNRGKRGVGVGRRARLLMPDRHAQTRGRVDMMGGYLDLPIIAAALSLDQAYVWVCEYDVDWAGDWADFFAGFADNDADLLTTTVRRHDEAPDWHHWRSAGAPDAVARERWLRAFHPLMRLSRRFMTRYCGEMATPGWSGHYEFLLPTVAQHLGFRIEDLGGEGTFCPPDRRGRLYSNTHADRTLSPGTFVWRPALDRYSWQGGAPLGPHMLYHPIKTGIKEWELVRDRNEAAIAALKSHLKGGKVLRALAAAGRAQPAYLLRRMRARLQRPRPLPTPVR